MFKLKVGCSFQELSFSPLKILSRPSKNKKPGYENQVNTRSRLCQIYELSPSEQKGELVPVCSLEKGK